jgi:hypothetical protein
MTNVMHGSREIKGLAASSLWNMSQEFGSLRFLFVSCLSRATDRDNQQKKLSAADYVN